MVEKFTEQFGWQEYLNSGGRWSEETFDELMDMLAKKEENPIPVRHSSFEQAEGIKKFSGIEITPEEIYLYGILRERPVENSLPDIRLMAEVILLRGNIVKRRLFESRYPNIDFKDVVQVLEPRQSGVRQATYGQD